MKQKIISLNIDTVGYDETIANIVKLAKRQAPGYVCFANAHMTIEGYLNSEFAKAVNGASWVLADGVPIVKSLRLLHGVRQERVAGMDVMPSLIQQAELNGLNLFFFGTTPTVLDRIKMKVEQLYPRAKIVGLLSPPFSETWNDDLYVEQIRRSQANLVFVALGCPKQEKWMAQNSHKLNAVLLGVGGAFPIFAGLQQRAPLWVRNLSLEWVHRMFQEPRRLVRRYAKTNSFFLFLLLKAYGRKLLSRK